MSLPRVIYEPVPVNDLDDNRSSENLLASPKSALRYWHWLGHVLIFSLYTICFAALSGYFLENRSEQLQEICLARQSMQCKSRNSLAFSQIDLVASSACI